MRSYATIAIILALSATTTLIEVVQAQVAYTRSHHDDPHHVQEHLVVGKDMPHDFYEENVPDVYANSEEEVADHFRDADDSEYPKPTRKVAGPGG